MYASYIRRIFLAAILVAAAGGAAEAATITVVSTGQLASRNGLGKMVYQSTTVATFTAVQNIAQVTLNAGLWSCVGTSSNGTVTNASTITLSISSASGAHPTSSTGGGYPALISQVVMTTQANATAGFPQLTTGRAFFSVSVPTPVYLVETQTVTDTVTANLSCEMLGNV